MGFRGSRQNRDIARKRLRDESGQSIILVSIVIMSFLMFFSFAINTGLLINAKISVQSAADAAAYAGAATQARQLNAMSWLNYDMRRQYKKFMFRYVFVGSMGSNKFPQVNVTPKPAGDDYDFEKLDYADGDANHIKAVKVPVVCIPLTQAGTANDNCLFVNMKSTAHAVSSLSAGGNAIQQALIDNLTAIESVQQKICTGQGQMNLFVLISWLFRADTNVQELTNLLTQLGTVAQSQNSAIDIQTAVNNISPLVGGLGLYPRNIVDLMRIETLQGFINEKHALDVDAETVGSWEKDQSVSESRERTIQAFRSALANLNGSVFDPSLLKMDELQKDQMISTSNISVNFNAYVQQQSANAGASNGGATICGSSIDPFPVIGAPIGVRLDGVANVNYAVHLKAFIRPHGLLYLPNSDPLELDAFAGAKPFGSRIGPAKIGQTDFAKQVAPSVINGAVPNPCDGSTPADCWVPYMKVGGGQSTYSTQYLTDLMGKARPNGKDYTFAGIQLAQLYAMAPTPEEVGHYNIIPPPKNAGDANDKHQMQFEFIPYSSSSDSKSNAPLFRFYAPIFPAGKGDVRGKVTSFVDKIFDKTQVSNNVFNIKMDDMRNMVTTQITKYIESAMTDPSKSEHGETQTFASMELPMPPSLKPGKNFWLTEASQVLSSWAPTHLRLNGGDDGFGFDPRFGYSVKFVTMHDLATQGLSTDNEDVSKVNH
jgi:hypothetical protein